MLIVQVVNSIGQHFQVYIRVLVHGKGKGKGVPSSINEGRVPGGDPGPEPSPSQVAFSRAGAIQRLGGRSIRRTCGLPSQLFEYCYSLNG